MVKVTGVVLGSTRSLGGADIGFYVCGGFNTSQCEARVAYINPNVRATRGDDACARI